ncbi:MAG: hypothetical protein V1685_01485 [Parcubacteria group bacterium]
MEQQTTVQTKTQSTVLTVTMLAAACIAAAAVGFAFFVTKDLADTTVQLTNSTVVTTTVTPLKVIDIFEATISANPPASNGVAESGSDASYEFIGYPDDGSTVSFGQIDALGNYQDGNSPYPNPGYPFAVKVASDSYPETLITLSATGQFALNDTEGFDIIPKAHAQVGTRVAVCLPAKTAPPAHCTNGILDGDETGIDCGGADCPACTQAPCAANQCRNASGQCVNQTNTTCGINGAICVNCSTGGQTCNVATGTCTSGGGTSLLFGIPTAHAQVNLNGNTNSAPTETIYYVDSDGNTYSDRGLTNRLNTVDCQTLVQKAYAPADLYNVTSSGTLNLGQSTYASLTKSWSAPLGAYNSTDGFVDIGDDPLSLAPLFIIGGNTTGGVLNTPEMTITATDTNGAKNLCLPAQKDLADGDYFLYFYDTNGKPYADMLLQSRVACGQTNTCRAVNCTKQPLNVCCRYRDVMK